MKRHSKAWWLTPLAIMHWKRLRDDPVRPRENPLSDEWVGSRDCPYCRSFEAAWCSGCPLFVAPGRDRCFTTNSHYRRAAALYSNTAKKDLADGGPKRQGWVEACNAIIRVLFRAWRRCK